MKITVFLVYSTIIYSSLLYAFGYDKFHVLSIVAMTFSIITIFIVDYFEKEETNENRTKSKLLSINKGILSKGNIVIILSLNAIINVINVLFISDKLIFENFDDKSTFQIIPIATVLIAQIGGWFFQSVLVFILADIFGSEKKFNLYLKIIGVAYLGFLLSSLSGLIYNYVILDTSISVEELNSIVKESPVHIFLGKIGEYLTISMASYLVYSYDRFSQIKSLIIVALPSIIILSVYEFFAWYIN